jgi:hypothetical protein
LAKGQLYSNEKYISVWNLNLMKLELKSY